MMDYEKKYNEALERLRRYEGDMKLKVGEQKPVEWSEDDEQLIGFIFDLLNDLFWREDWAMSKEECLERLNSLRPQPKQEWSKEDEEMRYFVTEAVQSRYSDRELAKYLDPKIINEKKQLKQRLFDWLRDLRPSWKPGDQDELMKLRYAGTSTKLD